MSTIVITQPALAGEFVDPKEVDREGSGREQARGSHYDGFGLWKN
jgi:hypothetical protein